MTGELLRCLRKSAGIKATDLAENAGVHKSTISEYENGRRDIPAWVGWSLVRAIDQMLVERSSEFAKLRAQVVVALTDEQAA